MKMIDKKVHHTKTIKKVHHTTPNISSYRGSKKKKKGLENVTRKF